MRAFLLFLWLIVLSEQREEHFIDVKEIVKDTIHAVAQIPRAAAMGMTTINFTTAAPAPQLYHLFKLPADIMTDLAVNAGYMEGSTTASPSKVPWIVTRESENTNGNGQYGIQESPATAGLLPLSSLLPRMLGTPNVPVSQLPQPSLPASLHQTFPHSVPNFPQVPLLPNIPQESSSPRYAYRAMVQPDGQTLYIPVLLPPTQPPTLEQLLQQRANQRQTPQDSEMIKSTTTTQKPQILANSARYEANTFPPMINPFYNHNAMNGIMTLTQDALQRAMNTNYPSALKIPNYIPLATTTVPAPPVQPIKSPNTVSNSIRKVSADTERQVDVINGPEDERSTLVYESQAVPVPIDSANDMKKTVSLKSITSVHKEFLRASEPDEGHESVPMVDERLAFQTREEFEKDKYSLKKKIKKIKPVVTTENDLDSEAVREFDHLSSDVPRPRQSDAILKNPPKARVPTDEFLDHMDSIPTDSEEAELEKKERASSHNEPVLRRIHSIKTFLVDRKKSSEGHSEPSEPMNKQIEQEMERLGQVEDEDDENTVEDMDEETFLSDIEKQVESQTYKSSRVHPIKRKTITPNKIEKPGRLHCLNIANFAKQFSMSDVMEFALERCAYIENYYPQLPCQNVEAYMKECSKYY